MLQLFHKYQKSAFLVILAAILCMGMLLFDMNSFSNTASTQTAIQINDQEVSMRDFYNAKQNVDNFYRNTLGGLYQTLVDSGSIDTTSIAKEEIINNAVTAQFAKQQDLYVGQTSLAKQVQGFFEGGYTKEKYLSFLKNTGQSPTQFEQALANDYLPQLLRKIIADHVNVSDAEVKAALIKKETKYNYNNFIFDPKDYLNKVGSIDQKEIKELYEEQAGVYEIPEKVKIEYSIIDPQEHMELVELVEEDLELYYADNKDNFKVDEQVKAEIISISYDPEDTVQAIAQKSLADEIVAKINQGENFSKLASEHSSHPTAKTGGQLNWVKRGERSPEFETFAFSGLIGQPEIIDSGSSYDIYRVIDYKEARVQEYAEVKDSIKEILQRKDAPSFALVMAEDLYTEWQKGNESLKSFLAKENKKLEVKESDFFTANDSVDSRFPKLISKVLSQKDLTKQIHEEGDFIILAEIKDYQESRIPDLKEVRKEVVDELKKNKSIELAREAAQKFQEKLSKNPKLKIAELKKEFRFTIEKREETTRTDQHPELRIAELSKDLFNSKPFKVLGQVYQSADKNYVVKVNRVIVPKFKDLKDQFADEKSKLERQLAGLTNQSILNKLKAEAEIIISDSINNQL